MQNIGKTIKKILIVDDFPIMRRIVRNLLKQMGFADANIDETENGLDALQKLTKGGYDMVISDWNMPIMEGLELLKAVRKDDKLKDVIFIMVTAEAEREKVIEAIKAGADSYIVKPFTGEVLQEKIEKVLQKRSKC